MTGLCTLRRWWDPSRVGLWTTASMDGRLALPLAGFLVVVPHMRSDPG
jgi:hypothetical protein